MDPGSRIVSAWDALVRPGAAWWIVLAFAGWSVAGIAAITVVHEHQVAGRSAAFVGLTPVVGPGVTIVVTDAARPIEQEEDPSFALVQDGDLIVLNMLLWYGGARAVAINGERITAQSTITSSGPTILINGHRLVGPFHVVAVGEPDALRGVLGTGGFVERMRQNGLGIEILAQREVLVPSSRPPVDVP